MNEITNTTTQGQELKLIDNLAQQAQMFSCGAAMNLLQLGRVLTEAKPLVSQGDWMEWVQTNAHLPVRRAQEYMQAYRKFGIDQRIAQLGPSQIIALLPMSDEERETLMAENSVADMTNRELKEAIRETRERTRTEAMEEARAAIAQAEEAQAEALQAARDAAARADAAREEAERRARELEARGPEVPPELAEELAQSRAEIERIGQTAREAVEEANRLRREKSRLEQDIQEQEDILREQQEAVNQAQEELLNLKSAQARGEERVCSDELTAEVMIQAAREFMGICARGPYMSAAFAAMDWREKQKYAEVAAMIREWVNGMENALNTVEGGVVIE